MSIYSVLTEENIVEVIKKTSLANLDLISSNVDLSGIELKLVEIAVEHLN